MERRELLRWMIATGGLGVVHRLGAQDLITLGEGAHTRADSTSALRLLTPAQSAIVTMAAESIIPATDTPGATDAKVTAFIDTMLSDWYSPAERDVFLAGVTALDQRATTQFGTSFVAATPAQQFALLNAADAEVSALRSTPRADANAHWFAMLKFLTVWGYCTSELGMTQFLHNAIMPMRYDGNAPLAPR
jgi:hypothetical protein